MIGIQHQHSLKIWPEWFEAAAAGRKSFEIRKDDRGFRVGDVVWLREWDPHAYAGNDFPGGYTGRELFVRIVYITDYEQKPGYVVFGTERI